MPKLSRAGTRRLQAVKESAIAPPAGVRMSRAERNARLTMVDHLLSAKRIMPSGLTARSTGVRSRISRFLEPDTQSDRKWQKSRTARDEARDRLRRVCNEWDQANGILSLDEMMALAALGLSDDVPMAKWRRKYAANVERNLDRRREDLAWAACSLEYALIWLFCDADPELNVGASAIAEARTRLPMTIERALRFYIAVLGQNLRARGIAPDRVVKFARTGRRPVNPILPQGMTSDEVEAAGWKDRSPLGRAMEKGSMRVEI